MILAAGLSPAWQQIVTLETLRPGQVNRAREVTWCGSGKVLNVGLACHRLSSAGASRVLTLSPLGGPAYEPISREFADFGMNAQWVRSAVPTRVCTTLLDAETGVTTEIVENSRELPVEEQEEYFMAYGAFAAKAGVVVLTGSLPSGMPASFYARLAAATPGRMILDFRGEGLLQALPSKPFMVKPNREELIQTVVGTISNAADLIAAMRKLNALGAEWVVVTDGPQSVWMSGHGEVYHAEPPRVDVVNPIGCGDCLAAGFAVALEAGQTVTDALRLGIAAASENARVLLPARITQAAVQAVAKTIRVERTSE